MSDRCQCIPGPLDTIPVFFYTPMPYNRYNPQSSLEQPIREARIVSHWEAFNPTPEVEQRKNLRLYSWALYQRWPIPADKRVEIVDECMAALKSGNERNRQMAVKNLLTMDRLNLLQEIEDKRPRGVLAAQLELAAHDTTEITDQTDVQERIAQKRKAGLLAVKQKQTGNI